MVKRGDIVLIRYPFTDLSSSKVRPAVIITPDYLINKIDDILCLFISSSIQDDVLISDFILDTNNINFHMTGLKSKSVFRAHKLALLNKSLILRLLGNLHPDLIIEIDKHLKIALGLL